MTAGPRPQRIVIAPDSFKGSISATAAAEAIAAGWRSARPADHLVLLPMADGGEGTVEVIASALAAPLVRSRVADAVGAPTIARWARHGDVGIIELAESSGLAALSALAPVTASTRGFGENIVAALDAGVTELVLALGGSSSTDAGAGLLTALGASITDEEGNLVPSGLRGLLRACHVDLSRMRRLPRGGAVVLSDVDAPAVGPRGAATVFGPQKGLRGQEIAVADAAVRRFARLLGVDPDLPGSGAAGATGLALAAWGARFESGAATVASIIGLPDALRDADLVITGEGRLDAQTDSGKVMSRVRRLGQAAGVPTAMVVGSVAEGITPRESLIELAALAGSTAAAIAEPARWLRRGATELALAV